MDLTITPSAPADQRAARCPTRRLKALKDYFERLRDYAERAGERSRACTLNEVLMIVSAELCVFEVLYRSVKDEPKAAPTTLEQIAPEELPGFLQDLMELDAAKLGGRFRETGHPRLKAVR